MTRSFRCDVGDGTAPVSQLHAHDVVPIGYRQRLRGSVENPEYDHSSREADAERQYGRSGGSWRAPEAANGKANSVKGVQHDEGPMLAVFADTDLAWSS
ncbi:MAG: hypothetical protein O2973_03755 [Gemmatimonadetes bacterium]|nr:hypothetical protein [Gemmatimonadota bacterium]